MSLFATHHPRRALLGSAALTAAILCAGPLSVNTTHAAVACRSDPVLVVNGATVDVVSTLWSSAGNIREIDYVVTVPAGSVINQTTLTVGLGFPEKVTYVFSKAQRWDTMKIATTVQVQKGVAPFPISVTATSPLSLLTGTTSASGMSNSTVTLNVGNLIMV